MLVDDRLLDEPDRRSPAALVQDEQGALLLFDLLGDLSHELVVDAGVVDAAAQAPEDAAGRAHGDGTRRSGDDRPGEHTEGADADSCLHGPTISRLMDLHPAEAGPIHDCGVDDLHVAVHLVDALDRLQEAPRRIAVVDDERRQGLVSLLFAHRVRLLSLFDALWVPTETPARDGGVSAGDHRRRRASLRPGGCVALTMAVDRPWPSSFQRSEARRRGIARDGSRLTRRWAPSAAFDGLSRPWAFRPVNVADTTSPDAAGRSLDEGSSDEDGVRKTDDLAPEGTRGPTAKRSTPLIQPAAYLTTS